MLNSQLKNKHECLFFNDAMDGSWFQTESMFAVPANSQVQLYKDV